MLSEPTAGAAPARLKLRVELRDGGKLVVRGNRGRRFRPQGGAPVVSLTKLDSIELWDLEHPKLYTVTAQILDGGKVVDGYSTRIGFREARFTPRVFN